MADSIFDPATNVGRAVNPQVQTTDTHQDIFGGSNDVFNNPDMFQAVAPEAPKPAEEFHLDLDQLEANHYESAPAEPEIIEPQAQETRDEYQAKQTIPEPVIIEQAQPQEVAPAIEPEILGPDTGKPEVVVNPRKAPSVQTTVQQVKPQVRPVQVPVQQVKPQVQQPRPQVQPQIRPVQQPVQVVKAPEIEVAPVPESREVEPQKAPSDLQKKLNELIGIAKNIYTLEKRESDETLEILGANNDKVTILYQITLPENGIMMKKIETDTTQEEVVNDLGFVLDTDTNSVQIILDDVLLFDEIEHLQDDAKKKMQVTEKLNKFIFLLGEHQKKMEKEAKEKEEAEQERRRLQDIFRNF